VTPREVGLKAVESAQLARGRAKLSIVSPVAWAVVVGSAVVALCIGSWVSHRRVAAGKVQFLARREAATSDVQRRWAVIRESIENYTAQAAKTFDVDSIAPQARTADLRKKSAVYLRMRMNLGIDPSTIRAESTHSALDAFTACFFEARHPHRLSNPTPIDNGARVSKPPPWNLQHVYRAARVVESAWEQEARAADSELRLRVFQHQYDQAERDDLPQLRDDYTHADIFVLVLDETPEAAPSQTVTTEQLLASAHPVRVHVFDLATQRELIRIRRTVEGSTIPVAGAADHDPDTNAAVRRQVNNCELASEVIRSIRSST